jgi:adenosylhomocysteinase
VVVCEVDPLRALEAVMDGFRVLPMAEAAREGDIFVTVTGDRDVLGPNHFRVMKDGAILANSGHFDVEIDLKTLAEMTGPGGPRQVRPSVEEYLVDDGGEPRRILVVAQGRLVNLGAAEGHPAAVMDMSFANQALCVEWAHANRGRLEPRVYDVPAAIDREVARLKLDSMRVQIDTLSPTQEAYLRSWTSGT